MKKYQKKMLKRVKKEWGKIKKTSFVCSFVCVTATEEYLEENETRRFYPVILGSPKSEYLITKFKKLPKTSDITIKVRRGEV